MHIPNNQNQSTNLTCTDRQTDIIPNYFYEFKRTQNGNFCEKLNINLFTHSITSVNYLCEKVKNMQIKLTRNTLSQILLAV